MKTYISILRGVNVSGKNKLKMEELRSLYASLGFTQVRSYVQSGNVVFDAPATTIDALEKKLQAAITRQFGMEVPVLVKDAAAWVKIVEQNPFLPEMKDHSAQLHVTFLSQKPEQKAVEKLAAVAAGEDKFILKEENLYLYCPNGYGNTKLSNTTIEKKLQVTATTRNWRTVNELMALATPEK